MPCFRTEFDLSWKDKRYIRKRLRSIVVPNINTGDYKGMAPEMLFRTMARRRCERHVWVAELDQFIEAFNKSARDVSIVYCPVDLPYCFTAVAQLVEKVLGKRGIHYPMDVYLNDQGVWYYGWKID